ncbi:unnamed protein product [Caenorhabditis brenneri]
MKLVIVFAVLLVSASSEGGGKENIGDIIHKIQNFFTFLCTRCKEVVGVIDSAIDSQSLKKDANALCEAVLGFNEVTEKVCKSVVEDILGELYTQLKKFEPDHLACSHLHLCDSCIIPGSNTTAPTLRPQPHKIKEIDTAKLVHGIAKLHHLAFTLSNNITEPLIFYHQNVNS